MAYDDTKMQAVAGAGLSRIFTYQTADAIATVTASGYFNSKFAELKQFDIIHVIGSTGSTPTIDTVFVTSATAAATVTTSATEGVTAT